MAFPQFDIADVLRCAATDEEGFRCTRPPSHDGGHRWGRCEHRDGGGHRCMHTPGQPSDHEQPWYDRDAVAGETRAIRYHGTEREASAWADKAQRISSRYGWIARSRVFSVSFLWRWQPVARLLATASPPRGHLTVVFEYRPSGPESRT
jgi:hypothetical protein